MQGFGNVGSVVCQELAQRGVKIVAVGDRYGAIRNPRGIDIAGPDPARRRPASCCAISPAPSRSPPTSC